MRASQWNIKKDGEGSEWLRSILLMVKMVTASSMERDATLRQLTPGWPLWPVTTPLTLPPNTVSRGILMQFSFLFTWNILQHKNTSLGEKQTMKLIHPLSTHWIINIVLRKESPSLDGIFQYLSALWPLPSLGGFPKTCGNWINQFLRSVQELEARANNLRAISIINVYYIILVNDNQDLIHKKICLSTALW